MMAERKMFLTKLGAFNFGTTPPYFEGLSLEEKPLFKVDSEKYYIGQTLNGLSHGKGAMIYLNGDYHVGWWKNGMETGRGRFINFESDIYEGEWQQGKAHGCGTYRYRNGVVCQGEWI
mmetsp:Transcript_14540/g.14158  ORF Transcript_14540/g.14158 Transcript_14540/m.14158 type:complete len:118 (+) Transcript_14540:384-737(+)